MFRRLRIKLTLINVCVTIALFAILIVGFYILVDYNANRASDYVLKKIAANVRDNKIADFPARERQKSDYPGFFPPTPRAYFFFVKTGAGGAIESSSSNTIIQEKQLAELVEQALGKKSDRSRAICFGASFDYYKIPREDAPGTIIVFNDLTDQEEALHTLIANLSLAGLFCSLISFVASYFMANHAIRPIQESLIKQNNFVSDASHELRTPIAIMQTNLDILNSAPPGDTIENNRKWLQNIQDETSRMAELINSLLFLARADANRQLMEKEYFSLRDVILDATRAFAVVAEQKEIHLKAAAADHLTALGDPARIKQALTILLDNALRHTSSGGAIDVIAGAEQERLFIKVADTGEGIASEHMDRLFDRFYQADESRNKGGAGLGLPMAKWIVDRHGGAISIESELGKGTVVTIRLPRASLRA